MFPLPPIEAIIVYYLCFAILFLLLDTKTTKTVTSLFVAFGVTLVGSEYWELPIFIYAWLGLFNHTVVLIGEVYHALILWLFILLLSFAKVKIDKITIASLLGGILLSFVLLPPSPLFISALLTRAASLTCLSFAFYRGSQL